ncbi:MAG: serine/threonine protein kinase, partial [Desulfosarcina sp.]|nr:serine/threonine protein kinase [Desulfobacterales bacterium]
MVAGSAIVWYLSGILIQTGAGLLGVLLTGIISTLVPMASSRDFSAYPATPPKPTGRYPSPLREKPAAQNDNRKRDVKKPYVADHPGKDDTPAASELEEKQTKIDILGAIDRYQTIRLIGKGAMGEVFLGRDPHINRLTAIKTLRFEDNFVQDEIAEIRDKFFREAESAGTLSHAHIVTIYDAGEDRDLAYIAMEYLEGVTLLRFTQRKRLLPVRKIIAYLAQIARALDYAHTRGIVHRDIKPANIMVLKNGTIKITDFGIARITASSHTQTGVVKGTPYYMSPEQFSGAKVDGRSDIFSLGTLLFQLLTGTLPFFSESPAVLMNQIMNFPHPNPRAINPRVITAIIPIVDKALEKERNRRYQRAGQMAADLIKLDQRIESYLERKTRSDQGL